MQINCYECNEKVFFEEGQKVEYCPVCGEVTYLTNEPLIFDKTTSQQIKKMFQAIETNNFYLAKDFINKILRKDSNNIFANIGLALDNLNKYQYPRFLLNESAEEGLRLITTNKNIKSTLDISNNLTISLNRAEALVDVLLELNLIERDEKERKLSSLVKEENLESVISKIIEIEKNQNNNMNRGINKINKFKELIDEIYIKRIKYAEKLSGINVFYGDV